MKLNIFYLFSLMQIGVFTNAEAQSNLAKVQEINIGNGDDPKTLDPQKCNDTTCSSLINQLFEGLITNDVDGKIIPASAESWKISPDGKTYTFYLRNGIKWSDGSRVTAKDFEYSFKRLVDPKVASDQGSILENVINGKDILEGKKPTSSLGVKAVNETTLEIKLSKAIVSFLDILTIRNTFPVQQKNVEKYPDSFTMVENLVSNGPFKLSYRKVGDKVTIIRNSNYWNSKKIHIEKVNFHSIADLNTEFNMYEAGQLDITDKLPTHLYKTVKAKYGKQLINDPYLSSYIYIFNNQKAPFTNKNLRKALSIAIDRNVIAHSVLGAGEKPLYEVVPYGLKNYSHNKLYWQDWSREKQLEEAKRFYKEAGYSDKKPLTVHILYNTNEAHKKIATAIASMWKKDLGVNAVTVNEEWKTMLDRRKNGDFEVLRMGNIADFNDISNVFTGYRSNDSYNASKYKNPQYDEIVNQAIVELNPEKRNLLMQKAGDILKEEMPVAPIYSYVFVYLVKPHVIGFKKDAMKNFSLVNVYIQDKNSLN